MTIQIHLPMTMDDHPDTGTTLKDATESFFDIVRKSVLISNESENT